MNTAIDLPGFLRGAAVNQPPQRDLFGQIDTPPPAPPLEAGLFADIVFDRPLDHAYSYAVPEGLSEAIAVGKRVLAPFGRGDKATVGYCVRLSNSAPTRTVKALYRVIDNEVLLTPDLLRLTRWMADYYLCGWGQVLNAVVPAGARERSGSRTITLLEAVPPAELPAELPELTPKQKIALQHLRDEGRAMEPRQLARLARCGSGPIEALVDKGLVRKSTRRVDRFTQTTEEGIPPDPSLRLNADQLQAWAPIEHALHGGGFHAFLLYGVTGSGKRKSTCARSRKSSGKARRRSSSFRKSA